MSLHQYNPNSAKKFNHGYNSFGFEAPCLSAESVAERVESGPSHEVRHNATGVTSRANGAHHTSRPWR